MAAHDASIEQPVVIAGPTGKVLAGPAIPKTKPKSTFQVSRKMLTCSGTTTIRCNNGLIGRVSISREPPLPGFEIATELKISRDVKVICRGSFYETGERAGPFGTTCRYLVQEWADFQKTKKAWVSGGHVRGAAFVRKSSSGAKKITFWVPPIQ
jgi:hypothetical protein